MDEFELALDDCVQQLIDGRSSLGQCLARHQKYAAELRPLLETALRLREGKSARPTGPARDRMRAKIAERLKSDPKEPREKQEVPRLIFAVMSLALAFALAGTMAAQAALPGQSLYQWKLSTESAWRATAPDPAAVDLSIAERRSSEILALTANGAPSTPEAEAQGLAAYNSVLYRLASETNGPDGAAILTELQTDQKEFAHAGIHVAALDNLVMHNQQHNPGHHKP